MSCPLSVLTTPSAFPLVSSSSPEIPSLLLVILPSLLFLPLHHHNSTHLPSPLHSIIILLLIHLITVILIIVILIIVINVIVIIVIVIIVMVF